MSRNIHKSLLYYTNSAFILLLIAGVQFIFAQETQITQHVEVNVAAGTVHSLVASPGTGVHAVTMTVGQPFVGRANSGNYATDMGIWSFYVMEPQAPVVNATDGAAAHPSAIKISFTQDVLSPPGTGEVPSGESFPENQWKLTRDDEFRANLPITTEIFADDQSIFPGQLYNYGVKISNQFGISDEGFDG
ncbi:MAG: hypothetical protein KAI81_09090, partial [Candidatus Marinimicrobia bacterium]|nr:hypothetical protein [Candidatus Neomarinimicrobiota bacterium]